MSQALALPFASWSLGRRITACAFAAVAATALAWAAVYLSGVLFLLLSKADPRQASWGSIATYWQLYADDDVLRQRLLVAMALSGGGLRMDEIKGLLRIVIDVIVQFDRDERGRFIADVAYEPRRWQPPQTQLRASTLLAPESAFGDGAPS